MLVINSVRKGIDVVNDLTTGDATKALSAEMGMVLQSNKSDKPQPFNQNSFLMNELAALNFLILVFNDVSFGNLNGWYIQGISCYNTKFNNLYMPSGTIQSCHFTSCSFVDAMFNDPISCTLFYNTNFYSCFFKNSVFYNNSFNGCNLDNSYFENSGIYATWFYTSTFTNAYFVYDCIPLMVDCNCSYASFHDSHCRTLYVSENCNNRYDYALFSNVDFAQGIFYVCKFIGAIFTNCNFVGVTFKDCDFTSATFPVSNINLMLGINMCNHFDGQQIKWTDGAKYTWEEANGLWVYASDQSTVTGNDWLGYEYTF